MIESNLAKDLALDLEPVNSIEKENKVLLTSLTAAQWGKHVTGAVSQKCAGASNGKIVLTPGLVLD
jgi:hypothetical protein